MSSFRQEGTKMSWMVGLVIFGLSILVAASPATAQPEKDLANCQKTIGKEMAKYVSAKQKAIAGCLNKIAKERIQDAAGDAAGAAAGCTSSLRKLVNTEDPSKELDAKLQAKIAKKCAGEPTDDVLGGLGQNVAGDAINAGLQMAIPCLHFGGDGIFTSATEWENCLIAMADAQAIRQAHMEYPNADAWLRDVRPDIVALGGDQKYVDAVTALDSVRRWVDNGDGTVTDYVTGLMWEKKTDDSLIHDKDNSYTWSTGTNDPDGTVFTTFLSTLNGGVTAVGNCTSSDNITQSGGFAGHCDWRLPTIAELQTILLKPAPCSNPCMDTTIFGPTLAPNYWSSTTSANFPSHAGRVGFNIGSVGLDNKIFSNHVRAVRGGL